MVYEDRLKALSIEDISVLNAAKKFRESRRQLIHEKAIQSTEISEKPLLRAQKVADESIDFVRAVSAALQRVKNN